MNLVRHNPYLARQSLLFAWREELRQQPGLQEIVFANSKIIWMNQCPDSRVVVSMRRTILGIFSVLVIGLVILAVKFRSVPTPTLEVFDQRLEVVDWSLKRRKSHSVFFAGLEGRVRQKLHEYKLPVTRFGGMTVNGPKEALALLIIYGGRLSGSEAQQVVAVLVDSHGSETKLEASGEAQNPGRKEVGRFWILKEELPKGSAILLRIGTNAPLAKITLE